jgi:hypothetical protein
VSVPWLKAETGERACAALGSAAAVAALRGVRLPADAETVLQGSLPRSLRFAPTGS